MGGLQPIHILLVVAVILILFGGTKIPQLMRGIGQGMGEFKKGQEETRRTFEETKKEDEAKKDDVKKDESLTGSEKK